MGRGLQRGPCLCLDWPSWSGGWGRGSLRANLFCVIVLWGGGVWGTMLTCVQTDPGPHGQVEGECGELSITYARIWCGVGGGVGGGALLVQGFGAFTVSINSWCHLHNGKSFNSFYS